MATDVSDMVDLSEDEVNELLSGRNQKGNYDADLQSFIAAGSRGRRFDTESGKYSGRNAASVVTGFKGAVKRATEAGTVQANQVRVIKGEGFVALVNAQAAS